MSFMSMKNLKGSNEKNHATFWIDSQFLNKVRHRLLSHRKESKGKERKGKERKGKETERSCKIVVVWIVLS